MNGCVVTSAAGPRRVFTSRALGSRRGGHAVRAWRRGRSAGLVVDGRFNVSGNAPAGRANMTLLPYIYIGNVYHVAVFLLSSVVNSTYSIHTTVYWSGYLYSSQVCPRSSNKRINFLSVSKNCMCLISIPTHTRSDMYNCTGRPLCWSLISLGSFYKSRGNVIFTLSK